MTEQKSGSMTGTIAKGAVGVAVGAAAVAAGVALMDEDRRNKIGKEAGKILGSLQEMAREEAPKLEKKVEKVRGTQAKAKEVK